MVTQPRRWTKSVDGISRPGFFGLTANWAAVRLLKFLWAQGTWAGSRLQAGKPLVAPHLGISFEFGIGIGKPTTVDADSSSEGSSFSLWQCFPNCRRIHNRSITQSHGCIRYCRSLICAILMEFHIGILVSYTLSHGHGLNAYRRPPRSLATGRFIRSLSLDEEVIQSQRFSFIWSVWTTDC